jgi:hypothetical protein
MQTLLRDAQSVSRVLSCSRRPRGTRSAHSGAPSEGERPTRTVATWLFDGWPDDEAVEAVILTEDGGITTMTHIMESKAPERWRAGQLGQPGRPAG